MSARTESEAVRLISPGNIGFSLGAQMVSFIVRISRQRLHFEPTKSLSLGQLSAGGLSSNDILVIRGSRGELDRARAPANFIIRDFYAPTRLGLLIDCSLGRSCRANYRKSSSGFNAVALKEPPSDPKPSAMDPKIFGAELTLSMATRSNNFAESSLTAQASFWNG